MNLNSIRTIIWDWNGTLLDDTDLVAKSTSHVLQKLEVDAVSTEDFRENFIQPISLFYQNIGLELSKDQFIETAVWFHDYYHENFLLSPPTLHIDSVSSLEFFKNRNCNQYILSAHPEGLLNELVKAKNISEYFKDIRGREDNLGLSKEHVGFDIIKTHNIHSDQCLLIGDTLHDKEVADALGCQCVIIPKGFQVRNRFYGRDVELFDSLSSVCDLFI